MSQAQLELGSGWLARPRLRSSPPSQVSQSQTHRRLGISPLRFISSLVLTKKKVSSLLSDSPWSSFPGGRRLSERRRHWSRLRPALCRRRAHPPGMRAPSLSFCCVRRSTPNPNKTICIRIWIQLRYITNFDFVCKSPCPILGPPLGVFLGNFNTFGLWSYACLSRWIIDYGTN